MVDFFIIWLALGVLAVVFLYCCSRVSSEPSPGQLRDDVAVDPPRPLTVAGPR